MLIKLLPKICRCFVSRHRSKRCQRGHFSHPSLKACGPSLGYTITAVGSAGSKMTKAIKTLRAFLIDSPCERVC